MKKTKKQVYDFLKQFKIADLSLQSLKSAISQQGYTIVEYSRISNLKDVEDLLNALGLKALSLTTGAFTFASPNHRIVFIEEGLSDEEQLILLSHEEGHIFCGHMSAGKGICGEDVLQEHEANTFSHYLMKNSVLRRFCLSAAIHKMRTFCISALLLVIVIILCISLFFYFQNRADYCITPTGERYHKPDCSAVQGHETMMGSKSEFKKIGKTPCGLCLK